MPDPKVKVAQKRERVIVKTTFKDVSLKLPGILSDQMKEIHFKEITIEMDGPQLTPGEMLSFFDFLQQYK